MEHYEKQIVDLKKKTVNVEGTMLLKYSGVNIFITLDLKNISH
jgi:hypothetical protein